MVKQAELPFYYSAADVCVVPSYYESFGLVTLESLACGTPVVATAVGSAASVIRQGKTGYIVPDNNPDLLADSIEKALSLRENGDGLASLMRTSLERYRWPVIARAVVRECRSLLSA
jgi:D-inositol-3-phosphate glycosyltransferase